MINGNNVNYCFRWKVLASMEARTIGHDRMVNFVGKNKLQLSFQITKSLNLWGNIPFFQPFDH